MKNKRTQGILVWALRMSRFISFLCQWRSAHVQWSRSNWNERKTRWCKRSHNCMNHEINWIKYESQFNVNCETWKWVIHSADARVTSSDKLLIYAKLFDIIIFPSVSLICAMHRSARTNCLKNAHWFDCYASLFCGSYDRKRIASGHRNESEIIDWWSLDDSLTARPFTVCIIRCTDRCTLKPSRQMTEELVSLAKLKIHLFRL